MTKYIVQGDEPGLYGIVTAKSPKEAVIKFESASYGIPQKDIREDMKNVKGIKKGKTIHYPGYWVTERKPDTDTMRAVNMHL